MIRRLSLLAATLFCSYAAHAGTITFSGITITCDEVDWINPDGSYQCNNPDVKGQVSNGVTTLSLDATVEVQSKAADVQAQGTGVCILLGYTAYVSETVQTYTEADGPTEALGPAARFDATGALVGLDKTAHQVVSSITCK